LPFKRYKDIIYVVNLTLQMRQRLKLVSD